MTSGEQIIRNFQLYIIADIELDSNLNSLFEHLNSMFEHLKVYKNDNMSFLKNSTFYGYSKEKIYIEHQISRNIIRINKTHMSNYLTSTYNLSSKNVCIIIKWWLSKFLPINDETIVNTMGYNYNNRYHILIDKTSWKL